VEKGLVLLDVSQRGLVKLQVLPYKLQPLPYCSV